MKIIGNKQIVCHISLLYFFFLPDGRWERALPAPDFVALLVLPSRRTFEAALAAFLEVTFFGALV